MTLKQLLLLHEVAKHDCNISSAAEAMFISQPGASRSLQELADELGIELFRREGKRLTGLTAEGHDIAMVAANILADMKKIRSIADRHRGNTKNVLAIAATRYAARYLVLPTLHRYDETHPGVAISVYEDAPERISKMLLAGEADMGFFADLPKRYAELAYFAIDEWKLMLVAHRSHSLKDVPDLSLRHLQRVEITTYNKESVARRAVEEAFAQAGSLPNINRSLSSTDLILADIGVSGRVGIIPETAFDPEAFPGLIRLGTDSLFPPIITWLCIRKQAFFGAHIYDFIVLLRPELDRQTVQLAQAGA